jgi:protein SCO1/2
MSNGAGKAKGGSGRAAKRGAKKASDAPAIGTKPLIAIGLACALLFAAFVAYTNKPVTPPRIGGPFVLTTQNGQNFSDADMLGRPYLVFFGYTHCPDICHTTLFELSEIMRALGPNANIGGMFVTVDPERDTPQTLKDYLSSFDPRIVGLTGAHEALDPMLKEYRIYAKRAPGDNPDYGVDHTTVVYLMDKTGHFVSAFNVSRKPAEAARELERYL